MGFLDARRLSWGVCCAARVRHRYCRQCTVHSRYLGSSPARIPSRRDEKKSSIKLRCITVCKLQALKPGWILELAQSTYAENGKKKTG